MSSKAEELAKMIERYNSGVGSQRMCEDYLQCAAELRRLAALEKAIMDAEPVVWANPYGGFLSATHMEQFATGLEKQTHTIPLYTLNGIKS